MTPRREIATKWQCARTGDCCLAAEVVVTWAELRAMREARPEVQPHVAAHPDARFARVLTPGGCPYLEREIDGTATCSIHASRPYNCRRFQCLRPDPATEPYETGGHLGCRNLSDRLDQSQHALHFYAANQRRAAVWARAHGWDKGMA
jgi:Fe-S-cluster containining protein